MKFKVRDGFSVQIAEGDIAKAGDIVDLDIDAARGCAHRLEPEDADAAAFLDSLVLRSFEDGPEGAGDGIVASVTAATTPAKAGIAPSLGSGAAALGGKEVKQLVGAK